MFHYNVSRPGCVNAAYGQHFDDDTPLRREGSRWLVIHGGEIEQRDRGLENSYRRKNERTVGAQKLMIGNMLWNRAHFVEKGDFPI